MILFFGLTSCLKDMLMDWGKLALSDNEQDKEVGLNRFFAYKLFVQSLSCKSHWKKLIDNKKIYLGRLTSCNMDHCCFTRSIPSFSAELALIIKKIKLSSTTSSHQDGSTDEKIRELFAGVSKVLDKINLNKINEMLCRFLCKFFSINSTFSGVLKEDKDQIVYFFRSLELDKQFFYIKKYCDDHENEVYASSPPFKKRRLLFLQ